jgi:hypothetical protein
MDDAQIRSCADPALTPAIVEQFVAAVGSEDPLAITVTSGGRRVLVPRPQTPDEALELARTYVGTSVVRVGITQFPAGIGSRDPSQLTLALFDDCENLKTGTSMFAKVARIVTNWYGRPTNADLLPQMLDDAFYAWKTGSFEGTYVYKAEDPGGPTFFHRAADTPQEPIASQPAARSASEPDQNAGMRVDLSRILGQ